jgi:ELWxxDGT repeat protein
MKISCLLSLLAFITLPKASSQTSAHQIADLNPGSAGSFPSNMTAFASAVYFSAYTFDTGRELWKYDGTNAVLAADINNTSHDIGGGLKEGNSSNPAWLTEFNGKLYFSAFEPRRGGELWRYDGLSASRVADISPDANDTIKFNPNSSWPTQLTVFNNMLYFSANSGIAIDNYELWQYDGTTTRQVANIHPDTGTNYSSYPKGLALFNGALYFMADDGAHGYELWKHDGANTSLIDLNPGGNQSSSYPKAFTQFGTSLLFVAYTDASGFELWKTDGSSTSLAADIVPGADSSSPDYLTVYNNALYFRATDPAHGYELWKYDASGAQLAAEINPSGDAYPKNLTVFKSNLYFTADDGLHGWELWKYDGATATLVTDLNPSGDSFPEQLTVVNDVLYFVATTPDTGYEVWKYDGNTVTQATDINPGAGDSYPQSLSNINGQLYFSATEDGVSDWELWTITGGNPSPTVSLTAPTEGATFLTTDNIIFAADANDDGSVSKVEFFANGLSIGSDTTSPYSIATTLAAGNYSINAKATDNLGATTTSAAVSITVKAPNPPPTVSVTSPIDSASFLTTDSITFSANANDDGSVSKVEFFANGLSVGSDTTSPYSISTTLAAGNYSITAKATDNLGATTTSAAVNIIVKASNPPPTVSLTSPAESVTFLTTDSIAFSADANDNGSVSKVEFFANGISIGSDTTSPYSIATTLAAGNYSITAKATDNLGATTTSAAVSITVKAPNPPPTVSLTSPAESATFLTTASITFSGDANDDGSVSKVEFFANGLSIGSDTTSPYSISTTLAAGNYSITAKATDNLGASTTSTAVSITVKAPNPPPTVSLTSPAESATFLTTDSITFSADANDDGSVSKVEFFANGVSIGSDTTFPYSISTTLAAGNYSITAKATDNLGATATSPSINISVRSPANQPPTITLSSEQAGKILLSPATVTLKAIAADPDGSIAQVEFFKDSVSQAIDPSDPFEMTVSALPAGVYSFTGVATDDSGAMTTSAPIQITVADRPKISSISQNSGSVTITANATSGVAQTLEGSLDLASWSAIETKTPSSEKVTFIDSVTAPRRFYRIEVK